MKGRSVSICPQAGLPWEARTRALRLRKRAEGSGGAQTGRPDSGGPRLQRIGSQPRSFVQAGRPVKCYCA